MNSHRCYWEAGKLQHVQQELSAGTGLAPVLMGIFLRATRSGEMPLLISKKKEHQLLQHSSALREYLEMQGSCLVPALFVFMKSWLGVFMVHPQTWNLQGAGTVLNPQRAKMLQNGKFLPIRETSGVETMTESLGKEKPSTRKHEPGCGLERG